MSINLENLLDQLRFNGITIGTIELRHLQRIFKTSPSLSRSELNDLFCTVLALNNNQKLTIQRVFKDTIPFDNDQLKIESTVDSTAANKENTNSVYKQKRQKQTHKAKNKPLNIWIIGLFLLISISLLFVLLAWDKKTPETNTPIPTIPNQTPPPKTNQNSLISDNQQEKIISWTAKIDHIQQISPWQRLLSPLLLMLGGGLGLIWLLHRALKRTRQREPKLITISKKSKFHQPKLKPDNHYYLLSPKQRHAMGWGINHYLSDQNLQQLDIEKTVANSAKQAIPSIHFKNARLQRQVWLWIDQSSQNPDLFQLSKEIKITLERLNIDIRLGYFNALPNQVYTAQGRLIWSYQQEPAEHQPLVAVLMDSDNINAAYQDQAEAETNTLRSLAEWQSLCLIDCSVRPGQLQAISHSVNDQLCTLMPQQITDWLSQQGEKQNNSLIECPLGDLYRWACACALPNHPLSESQVRDLHEALGLDCAWQFSALQRYNQGARNQLDFLAERPQRLREIEPQDLKKALAFWQDYYQETDRILSQLKDPKNSWQNSRKQQKLKLNIALLKLWKSKNFDQTVKTLHNYYKNKYLRGEVESQLMQYTCSGLLNDAENKGIGIDTDIKGILLPHQWQKISPKTRSLLLSMGFGGSVQQHPPQWDKATAALLGLLTGVTLLGLVWSVQALKPQQAQLKPLINSAKPENEAKQIAKFENTLTKNKQAIKPNQIAWIDWTQHIRFKEVKQTLTANISLDNNLQLIAIPLPKSGFFMMGSETGDSDEKPVHKVKLTKPFWMSQTEITFDQYDAYTKATGVKQASASWGRGKMPVISVSWSDAKGYIKWVTQTYKSPLKGLLCRLPSEAEWEYAARAGTTTKYPWGDDIGKNKANCDDCGSKWDNKQTAPVASFSANAFGLYDMNGNVWEWVEDKWHGNYQEAPTDAQAWLSGGDTSRVLRGGSWLNASDGLRSAFRNDLNPDDRSSIIGFRIVCSHPFTEN